MSEAASQVQRFLLEDLDIRGAVVSLGGVWQAMQQRRHYPPGLSSLLGQMAAVTAAIAGNLKQPGRLTLQIQGHGTVPLMVIDCDQSLNLRGHAKGEPDEAALDPRSLFGDGRLLLTLEVPGLDQPYQSFVPIEGESLAEVFSAYLRRSEQQPTGLWLAADTRAAACLFLQKMPDTDSRDPDGWARTQLLAGTVRSSELLELDAPTLLQRLFPDENIRVYAARPVRHEWPRNPAKVADMLRSLGREEIERIIAEHGEARINDELSNHEYVFSPEELRALFPPPGPLQ